MWTMLPLESSSCRSWARRRRSRRLQNWGSHDQDGVSGGKGGDEVPGLK